MGRVLTMDQNDNLGVDVPITGGLLLSAWSGSWLERVPEAAAILQAETNYSTRDAFNDGKDIYEYIHYLVDTHGLPVDMGNELWHCLTYLILNDYMSYEADEQIAGEA